MVDIRIYQPVVAFLSSAGVWEAAFATGAILAFIRRHKRVIV